MSHNNFIMPHSESESDLKVLDIKQEQEEIIGDTEENMAESVKKEAEDVDTSKESNQDDEEEELAEDNNAPKPKEDSEESRSVSSDAAEVNDVVTAGSESEASKKKQEAPQPMKRRPERELNHDNWDQEDEPEEKGEFIKATQEQMKERKVLTAKRKQKPDLATNNNPFGGLSLLSLGAGNNGTVPNFNFSFVTPQSNTKTSSEKNEKAEANKPNVPSMEDDDAHNGGASATSKN